MSNDLSKGLIPSENEIKTIMAQMMQTNPMQIPVVLMQIMVGRLMLKFLDKFKGELYSSIEALEKELDK